MKRIMLIVVISLLLPFNIFLWSQLTDAQRLAIKQDVSRIIQQNQQNQPLVLTTEQFIDRNQARHNIRKVLRENQGEVARQYFDAYAAILDTLVITYPMAARQVVDNLAELYAKDQDLTEILKFYKGAADYYLGFSQAAIDTLTDYLKKNPYSELSSLAFTMLLKTYVNAGREPEAYTMIAATSRTYNDEQNFLAGNVCFVTENDELAKFYLQNVKPGEFKQDAQFLLDMLLVLKDDPSDAVTEFKELQAANPNNPFIVLCLARLSNLTSNWEEAENYYAQYAALQKSYHDFKITYELATTYLNSGKTDRALQILETSMHEGNMGEYICPLFYLWSEVKTNLGQADAARDFSSLIYQSVTQNDRILDEKLALVSQVNELRNGLNQKPSLGEINQSIADLKIISSRLDTLNASLASHPYGLSAGDLYRLQLEERHAIMLYSVLLHDYIVAESLKDFQETQHTKQLNSLIQFYTNQLGKINTLQESARLISAQNPYLAVRNEIDDNLNLLDSILNNLYSLKNAQKSSVGIAQVDSMIVATERKKAETALLLDYYDYDNSDYIAIVKGINASEEETKQLLDNITITKTQFQNTYPRYISSREKRAISQDISNLPVLVPEYSKLIAGEQKYLDSVLANMDYAGIHIAFAETNYYDRDKASYENTSTFEQNQILYAANQTRKQKVYNLLTVYIDKFGSATENPGSLANPDINIYADAYFSLAELGSTIYPDKIEENLANYTKVLEKDPKFYLSDAVLYNIGFLSSSINKQKIENAILTYDTVGSTELRPASVRYTEDNFREAIDAYQKIADGFPGSVYHSESLFRLGYLYFEIGTDAARPIEYYDLAREFYDRIIDNPGNAYHYKALYQRGWTWLNSSNEEAYKQAISDFSAILKAIDQHELTDSTEAVGYALAAVKNIGFCLIGLDGADTGEEAKGVAYARNTLYAQLPVQYLTAILDEAANQKVKLYVPAQAIDYMQARLEVNPLDIKNPIIADSICTLCKLYPAQIQRGIPADSIYIARRLDILVNYGLDSQWFAVNRDKNITRQKAIIRRSYADLERYYNNGFLDNPSLTQFNQYLYLTNQYQKWENQIEPSDKTWLAETQANIIAQNLKLAEITGNPRYYLDLESRIYSYNDTNPANDMYLDLEGTAYDCARIVCDSLKINPASLKAQDSTFKLPLSDDQPAEFYRAATQRFADVLTNEKYKSTSNDKIYIAIILRQAELARDQGQFDLSSTYYQKIAGFDGYLPADIKRTALISIADNYESQKNYLEAEKWYKQAEAYALSKEDKDILHQYSLLQIQNAIDAAKCNGDNKQVAENYLRLAGEYQFSEPAKNLQFKGNAQIAYMRAGEYHKSIDLLMDIASTKSTPSDAFNFYRLAWTEADSVGLHSTADSLKDQFIGKFPASNEAYQVRLSQIDILASSPSTSKQAGDKYLVLYGDVINKKINPGKDNPSDLYLAAVTMYDQAGDLDNKDLYAEQFIAKYPEHNATPRLMEYLADSYLAKGNSIQYSRLAKDIFEKDMTNQTRYANVAKGKLKFIASDFEYSYTQQNWPVALAKIKEFKDLHTAYTKQGLILDFAPIYESFAKAESEYKDIQARQAFINQYNQQLAAIEKGFLKKTPDNLLKVNSNTGWKTNLTGGDNRILALKNTTASEIGKVRKLLETGNQYDLDANERLKGFNLICRVADHGAEALEIQINKYTQVAVEFANYKKRYKSSENELYAGINEQKTALLESILQYAQPYNIAMYKYYYLPGMRNTYTISAYDRLESLNSLPSLQMDVARMDNDWQTSYLEFGQPDIIKTYKQPIVPIVLENGTNIYQITIPANSKVIISKAVDSLQLCNYAFLNLVSPYSGDSKIMLNNEFIDYTISPIDTLNVGTNSLARYALIFGEGKFASGTNNLAIHLSNYDNDPVSVYINLITVTQAVEVDPALPADLND